MIEDVERDYFTGSVPLSSDKSQSFKDFFVFYQSDMAGRQVFFTWPNNSNIPYKILRLISIFTDSIKRRDGLNQSLRNVMKIN
jgi:hypothetical protein